MRRDCSSLLLVTVASDDTRGRSCCSFFAKSMRFVQRGALYTRACSSRAEVRHGLQMKQPHTAEPLLCSPCKSLAKCHSDPVDLMLRM
jgi:hypothetical protein